MTTDANLALLDWDSKGTTQLNNKLSNFVAQLQQMMDVTPLGDYVAYIDPTAIAECMPYCESPDDIAEDKFNNAVVRLDYEDGIPTVGGLPIWERLDGELIPYYKIFKEYRDMKYETTTITGSTNEMVSIGNRSIGRLAEKMNVSGRQLTILSKIYHWAMRCKAFDTFKIREITLKKQRQAEELECKHAKFSNELLEQAMKYLKEHPAQLNPKTALQMVEIGMKYGRISVGLAGDKPGSNAAAVHQTNINVSQTNNSADQMLNVANGSGGNDTAQGSKGSGHGSEVERQFANTMKDTGNLLSVLHVLNKSGAFTNVVQENNNSQNTNPTDKAMDEGDDFSDVIDITPLVNNKNKDNKEDDDA